MTNAVSIAQYGTNNPSWRNRIINGDMRIDQRNAGASKSINNTTAYTVDRWYVNFTGGTGTSQRVAGSSTFSNALRLTGGAGVSSGFFGQKIESVNISDCVSSTVTYKIRASSSVLTSLSWYARYPNAADNYSGITNIANGTIGITSTPTDYSFQIALPAGAANGLEVYFTFGAFTSGTLDITGVQLEAGSVATPFERRPYGTELQLCQRYFEKATLTYRGSAFNQAGVGYCMWLYKVTKRSSPTVAYVSSYYTSIESASEDGVNVAANNTNYPTIGVGSTASAEL